MLSCLRSLCDCFLSHPRKRLSKTYLENLKDIQERKFSTIKKPSLNLELIEISNPPNSSNQQPLLINTDEAAIMNDPNFEKSDNEDNINPTNQRDSVLKLEKYYESNIKTLFSAIIDKVQSPFDSFEKIHEDLKSSHNLVMYMSSEVDSYKNRIFTYRTEWIAPCDPEFLMNLFNDYQEQIKLSDNKMEEYYPIKTFGANENFHLVYLKYKKVLTYSPRDFCYLKCSQCLNTEKNIWIDCSQSISNDLLPDYEDIVRGSILLHGYYLEQMEVNGQANTKVRFYSQIDFRVSMPVFVSKTFSVMEMKKYVQRCVERIEALKTERKTKEFP